MFRIASRMVGAGAFGFTAGCMWQVSTTGAEELHHASPISCLSGRVWPPQNTLDTEPRPELKKEGWPSFFADGKVAADPTKGGLTTNWKVFKLEEKLPINHNTVKFVFSFDDPETEYTLPPCSTLELGVRLPGGQGAYRLYTPITPNNTKGGFECVVKLYTQGCFTPHLFKMNPGDAIFARVKHLKLKYKKGDYKNVGCIAGGTGIAPMLQVIRAVLSDPEDTTKVSLLFSNRRYRDILMKAELDDLAKRFPDRFNVTYCLQEPPLGWEGEVGRVTHSMVARTMPQPGPENIVCLSGPDKMMELVGGCNMANTYLWRNTSDLSLAVSRAKQVSSPIANNQGNMMQGILFECGYKDGEVYRF
eukprot:TRINITY_DN838_c0_g2_i1.p1 TRINITY_DN838_c0_g2~~TRINITY_DN838_c0_g2_i1.p1  ORF type:complete len:378 (+),score=135.78 TRINITY_DN838_c0_g2_i1:52-1134(+)